MVSVAMFSGRHLKYVSWGISNSGANLLDALGLGGVDMKENEGQDADFDLCRPRHFAGSSESPVFPTDRQRHL